VGPQLTVLLTRPEGRNEKLARRLAPFGRFKVEIEPLVAIEPLSDDPVPVEGYDWIVITSATGAHELRRRMRGHPRRVAAIGRATAEAFGRADLVPRVSTQEGLLAEMPRPFGRVLFAGAEHARRLLIDELEAEFVPLYRTRLLRPTRPLHVDLVVLASASAAKAYAALGLRAPAVSIGPETTRAAREAGIRVLEEASAPSVDALSAAVLRAAR